MENPFEKSEILFCIFGFFIFNGEEGIWLTKRHFCSSLGAACMPIILQNFRTYCFCCFHPLKHIRALVLYVKKSVNFCFSDIFLPFTNREERDKTKVEGDCRRKVVSYISYNRNYSIFFCNFRILIFGFACSLAFYALRTHYNNNTMFNTANERMKMRFLGTKPSTAQPFHLHSNAKWLSEQTSTELLRNFLHLQ